MIRGGLRGWFVRRIFGDAKEMMHADANMLAIHYYDTPVPFWPSEHPTILEGVPHETAPSPSA